MESAVNNTTQINMGEPKDYGVVGQRNFADSSARQISAEISRNEYRKAVISDERMQQFREAVYKMVSGWATEDKIAIITEYGDRAFLNKYKNPSETVINKVCTESIIVHLDPADLRQLYNDIGIKEKKMAKDIRQINTDQSEARRRLPRANLNTAGFEQIYNQHAKYAYNVQDYVQARKDGDPSYSVPPAIERQYGTLRRELDDVLKTCFNKIEIQTIAFSMGIQIPEGTPFVRLRRWIINKTCLYVDLIVGRGRATYANAILDPKPYNNLLKYTSYSYITGEPGLDPKQFNELKKQARIAQVAMRERAKMQSYEKRNFKSKAMEELSGAKGSMAKVAKQLKDNDRGILRDATYDQLVTLAGKYGIDPTSKENKNVGMLKAKIYNAMLNESKRVGYLEKQKRRLEAKGKTTREVDDLLAVHRGFSDSSILKKPEEIIPEEKIPIVHFRNNGSLKERRVLAAVPVYLVGQGGAGSQKDNRTDSEKEEDVKQTLKDAHNSLNKLVGAKYKKKFFSKPKSLKMVTDRNDLGEKDKEIYDMFIRLPLLSQRTGVSNANENTFNSMYDFIFNFDKRYHLIVDGQPMSLMAMLASRVLGFSIIISSNKIVVDDKHTDVLNRLRALNNSNKEADVKEVFRIKHFLIYIYGLQIKSSDLCNFMYNIDENIKNYAKKIVVKKNVNPMWKDNAKTARKAAALMGGKTTNQTKFGKLIKGLDITKNLKAHFSGQRPLRPEELKDRSFYDSIMNILTQYGNGETPESYNNAYTALRGHLLPVDGSVHTGLSRDKFEALERNIPEGKPASIAYARKRFYILAAILSKLNSKIPTYNLFMYLAGIIDDKGKPTAGNGDLLNMINACFNLKGKTTSIFKKITSALKGAFTREKNPTQSNSKVDYTSQDFVGNKVLREQKISEEVNADVYDPEKNPGQRLPIPKIELHDERYPAEKILEAVPVYVVNDNINKEYFEILTTKIHSSIDNISSQIDISIFNNYNQFEQVIKKLGDINIQNEAIASTTTSIFNSIELILGHLEDLEGLKYDVHSIYRIQQNFVSNTYNQLNKIIDLLDSFNLTANNVLNTKWCECPDYTELLEQIAYNTHKNIDTYDYTHRIYEKIKDWKIPIVEFNGDPIPPSETPEVIPVYVVNQLTNEILDAIDILIEIRDSKRFTEGIGGNSQNVKDYYQKRLDAGDTDIKDTDIPSGKNRVKLTKEAKVIAKEIIDAGIADGSNYKPRSAIFNGRGSQPGKSYTIKDEDLQFAIKHNIKFAHGGSVPAGVPAIVGDNPNGNNKEHLEVVKGRPDGGVDVVPVENKLTRKARTPISQKLDKIVNFKSNLHDKANALLHSKLDKPKNTTEEDKPAEKQSPSEIKKIEEAEAKAEIRKEEIKGKKSKKKKNKENQLIKMTELTGKLVDTKGYVSANAKAVGVENIFAMPAIPVMAVNRSLNGTELLDTMTSFMKSVNSHMTDLKLGLATEVVTAPMGVGAITRPMMIAGGVVDKVANIAGQVMDVAMDTMIDSLQANTGGVVSRTYTGGKLTRFATGGSSAKPAGKGKLPAGKLAHSSTLARPKSIEKKSEDFLSVITGDAASSSNIFANGAKPELVQSQSDITVTPLNKTGEENKQKISRMTPSERAQALATAISSHIIKYKYTLPNGAEDVSNVGEAIKVFSVKPGITDEITIDGTTTSVAQMLMNIYNQLASISALETTNSGLLTTIANSSATSQVSNNPTIVSASATNVKQQKQPQTVSGNPFAGGFPDSLDGILGGY